MSDAVDQLQEILDADPETETPQEEPTAEAETPEPDEPETETVEEPDPAEPEEKLYAGKYKSPEELENAYAELQKTLGSQGSELGQLRDEISKLSERIPEYDEDDGYVPYDDANAQWFDTLMEENPVQAMEWARQNDKSGVYYNRGLQQWYDTNPAQAGTYQAAVIAQNLREEFKSSLSEQTKPLQAQAAVRSLEQAWTSLAHDIPDLDAHAEAMMAEAKESPEILRGANTAEEKRVALHKLYRLVRGSQAASLETARETAETEQKQANRQAKLSGTASQTKAVTPDPPTDEGEQWLEDIGFNAYLDRHSPDE